VILLTGIAAVTIWGVRYTNKPEFCNSCHIIQPLVQAWEKSPMANLPEGKRVTCVDCHFEPGLIGYVRGKVYSLMKLTEYGLRNYDTPPPTTELLTSTACLQCHGDDAKQVRPETVGRNVENPNDPSYPKILVPGQFEGKDQTLSFPHDFHVGKAQIDCAVCHSGVSHGAELTGNAPQADNTPEFCSGCHSGDAAPILFGEIKPSGREHPGIPKIDTAQWRNQHWKFTFGPGEVAGVQTDKIERETCLACHDEPAEAKNCKSCHFHSEPAFSPTNEAQSASAAPLSMFGLVIGIFLVTLVPYPKVKRFLFEGYVALIVGLVVIATDFYAFYQVLSMVLETSEGSREIGSVGVWIAYLLASASLLIFLFHQGVLKPRRRRLTHHD
jgi:nitrate/TMAO reductase-like tetraheme cytochrome c subunit